MSDMNTTDHFVVQMVQSDCCVCMCYVCSLWFIVGQSCLYEVRRSSHSSRPRLPEENIRFSAEIRVVKLGKPDPATRLKGKLEFETVVINGSHEVVGASSSEDFTSLTQMLEVRNNRCT